MAKATIDKTTVKPAVPAVTKREVVLTLTEDEASILLAVVGKGRAAGLTHSIYRALRDAGISTGRFRTTGLSSGFDVVKGVSPRPGSIYPYI